MHPPGAEGDGDIEHQVRGATEPPEAGRHGVESSRDHAVINVGDESDRDEDGHRHARRAHGAENDQRDREGEARQRQRPRQIVAETLPAGGERLAIYLTRTISTSKTRVDCGGIAPCTSRP